MSRPVPRPALQARPARPGVGGGSGEAQAQELPGRAAARATAARAIGGTAGVAGSAGGRWRRGRCAGRRVRRRRRQQRRRGSCRIGWWQWRQAEPRRQDVEAQEDVAVARACGGAGGAGGATTGSAGLGGAFAVCSRPISPVRRLRGNRRRQHAPQRMDARRQRQPSLPIKRRAALTRSRSAPPTTASAASTSRRPRPSAPLTGAASSTRCKRRCPTPSCTPRWSCCKATGRASATPSSASSTRSRTRARTRRTSSSTTSSRPAPSSARGARTTGASTGSWHCAEWHVDGATQTYEFFFDGTEVQQIRIQNGAGNNGTELEPDAPADGVHRSEGRLEQLPVRAPRLRGVDRRDRRRYRPHRLRKLTAPGGHTRANVLLC